MASTGELSSRVGSRLRRQRTLSVPVPSTSQAIPPPPTSQGLPLAPTLPQIAPFSSPQASTSSVAGPSAPSWGRGTGRRGPTRGVTERRLPDGQQWNVFVVRGYGVDPTTDHFMSRMGVHFNGKSLDDAIVFVPAGVDSLEWQTMCEMWTTADERSQMHGRTPHRLEVFKKGRCKDLPDGSESWDAMTQMIAPSSDMDAESHTPATPEDAFISVMEKDRPGRVRCTGSGETLGTWYRSTRMSATSERERIMQAQLKVQEEKLKAQAEEMTQMREKTSQLENVATKVDEMSILLS
ncbi:hypothetical protein Taro_029319 [Colocasia esculenta]|uniref:Uncharacterized protein n=1 Tax=Colocasia esculenta TaxID=4460 RepID=A0A843VWV7_COLES|nr:hypothetical protein [Colocasia esculenta]